MFTTSSVNSLIYAPEAAKEAAAAGFILLSMVSVCRLVSMTDTQCTHISRLSGSSTTARIPPPAIVAT